MKHVSQVMDQMFKNLLETTLQQLGYSVRVVKFLNGYNSAVLEIDGEIIHVDDVGEYIESLNKKKKEGRQP